MLIRYAVGVAFAELRPTTTRPGFFSCLDDECGAGATPRRVYVNAQGGSG
jgi:hypothetical protein